MCSHPSTRDVDICRICRLDLNYSDQKTDLCPFDVTPSDYSELTKYNIFLSMTHNLCFLHTLKSAQTATDVDIDAVAVFLPSIRQTAMIQCGVCKITSCIEDALQFQKRMHKSSSSSSHVNISK